jgi:two-component system, OmpR family, osmolarity sensor histidine kinase EnvZ
MTKLSLPWTFAPKLRSLFARLLLAQLGLVLALGLVFGSLFYVERNTTMAVLYSELWAPQLIKALQMPNAAQLPLEMQRSYERPETARRTLRYTPRFAAVRTALIARGVPVQEVMIDITNSTPLVWLAVQAPGQQTVWFGIAARLVEPEWPMRLLLALTATLALLVGASWAFTRKLTLPLEQLQQRIQAHTPGNAGSFDQAAPLMRQASDEVSAIAGAYADLVGRLERHERERAVLLAGVSHDLRSPLARIRLAAELLPAQPQIEQRQASIVRNVAEAERLIESFVDFVRTGETAFDQTVDLAAIGRAAVAKFDRPPHELSIHAPDAAPWLAANQLLLERLMANLIDNALKHGRPPVRVLIATNPSGTQASIEVTDSGDGMPESTAQAMQEAFTRGDSSRSQSGSGLGLAIVRQVVSRLGGELRFEQSPHSYSARVNLVRKH